MSRSPQLRLEDIAEACEQVEGYVRGYDAGRFAADNRTRDAAVNNAPALRAACLRLLGRPLGK